MPIFHEDQMTRYLRITGDLAQVVDEQIVSQSRTTDMLPLLSAPTPLRIAGLPSGIHSIYSDGAENRTHLIVQQNPNTRRIRYNRSDFVLAFPYLYWIFETQRTNNTTDGSLFLTDWRLFMSQTPLTTDDQVIKALPLHNISSDGRICFGSAAADPGATIGQHLNLLINNFWNSTFNDDIQPRGMPYNDYAAWQAASEEDPNCWQTWDWDPNGRYATTLNDLIPEAHSRLDPVEHQNVIPEVPLGATWGRFNEWFTALPEEARLRLQEATRERQATA